MKNPPLFELCVESVHAALIAQAGGADRIELCGNLAISGVTPGSELVSQTMAALTIPVHILIRPRGGDFVYTKDEFALMRQQTLEAKAAGAAGVAIGVLLPDGRVDVARTRELAAIASPMRVTFHRAFDETPDLEEALEAVIATRADCLLTSGGKPSVLEGAAAIAALRQQAGSRITIMAGGGLTLGNMLEVLSKTGVSYLHGSLMRKTSGAASGLPASFAARPGATGAVHLEDVVEAMRLFKQNPELELAR